MAISILDQNDAAGTGTGATPSITLTAGAGNRRLIVAYSEEDTSAPGTITMTFGGNALTQRVSVAPDSSARTAIFDLLEANMPANGSQTLSITAGSSAPGWAYSYWLIDGADQGTPTTNSNSVLNGGAAGTTIGTTVTAAAAGAFLCAGMYKNNSTSTVTMTAPASSTLTLDTAGADASERLAFGHKLGSLSVGSNTVTFTHDSQTRRCIAAYLVEPAPEARNISGGFTLAAVTMAGLLLPTREVDGGILIDALTADGDADAFLRAFGNIVLDETVGMSGSIALIVSISGDIALAPVEVAGDILAAIREISGNVDLGVVTVTGALQVGDTRNVSGALTIGAVTVEGTAEVTGRVISGAIALGAVQVEGDVGAVITLDGVLTIPNATMGGAGLSAFSEAVGAATFGAVTVSGVVAAFKLVQGDVVLGAVLVSGSLRTQFPGSCVLLDEPAGTAELSSEPAFAATLLDEAAGTATLEFSA
jgi:hypothetical protein